MPTFSIRFPSLLPRTTRRSQVNPIRVHIHHRHQLLDDIPQRTHGKVQAIHPLDFSFFRNIHPATIVTIIKSCHGDPGLTARVHGLVVSSGLHSHPIVSNSLMHTYSKCGRFDRSFKIFSEMQNPDVVSWNTILSGFQKCTEALAFAVRMRRCGVRYDNVTFTTLLSLSSGARDIELGMQLHSALLISGFESDTIVGNAIVTLYMRGGRVRDAEKMFDGMPNRDLVSWNAMISGYTQDSDHVFDAIHMFLRMRREFEDLDHASFASAITACGHTKCLDLGRQIHGYVMKIALEAHLSVGNMLMSMYWKCGTDGCARRVFETMQGRDVVSWTTVISVDQENAVYRFKEMLSEGVYPNEVTFVALITGVSMNNSVLEGRAIHGLCYKSPFISEPNVSNSLITMYSGFASMDESRKVFDDTKYKELDTWNALISGYTLNNMCLEAFWVFSSVVSHSKPDQFTFGSAISAISRAETISLSCGQQSHCLAVKIGFDNDEHVVGALIDMYGKRGRIKDSESLFKATSHKGPIAWTSMITSHATHGNYEHVLSLFDAMVGSRMRPDSVTFLATLTACGRRGMIDKGLQIFTSMKDHQVEAWREHYASVVDMLGRAGRLHEAESFIKQMPMEPGVSTLQSLLGACRVHGDADMAQRMANALVELEPAEAGPYVVMSNIYVDRGEWEKAARVRKGMRERGVRKEVGLSWVDVRDGWDSMHMYGFSSKDTSHPRSEEIYGMVDCLRMNMRSLKDD